MDPNKFEFPEEEPKNDSYIEPGTIIVAILFLIMLLAFVCNPVGGSLW